ncbi:hypothetical protein GJR96_06910 [Haloferax sp. MBLA0076]|uniref:Uncharacterized protein n=1 Tax=Haloferax litoreum TaxID=2666140 RepID=A0A6A8GEZ5_9EURY|nr:MULTISPECIES: hypothetical protein [Haloferax]KAB1193189.1 hypothetical protein Hfx1148_06900 [Haloferax sp. CBA1148]MRX21685.1 hypothetical protein [Haloferax litoreum]
MSRQSTRRSFLRAGVLGGLSLGTLAAGTGTATAAEQTIVSGTLVAESGAKVNRDKISAAGRSYHTGETDANGEFEIAVGTNSEYEFTVHKAESGRELQPTKDGMPHVYMFEEVTVDDGPVDLGEIVLPTAHILDIRIVTPDGKPLTDARPKIRDDGFGVDPYRILVDDDGYAKIIEADFTGFEVVESVTVEVEPPRGETYPDATFTQAVYVDRPTVVTATVSETGVSWDVSKSEEKPESTASTSGESTATATSADTTRETEDTGTEAQTTDANETTPDRPTRGFLSNGASAEDLGALNDPFVLTVGGFLLSVLGIAHNLVRGY